jgi:hypothetical protein
MNRVYTTVFTIAFFIVSAPQIIYAQCNCSATTAATPVSYYASFPSTNAASTTISLPKFDPSVGILSCLSFDDTVNGVTTTKVQNTGSTTTIFKFLLTVADDLEGPAGTGISITNSYSKTYGPDTLTSLGNIGDTATHGPDIIIDNEIGNATTNTGLAPFMGAGNVDFSFTINGGVVSLKGGLNYAQNVSTNYWGNFKITYYWCPLITLSTTITNFTASQGNGSILLQWLSNNQQPNTQYEIQGSKDGKSYYPLGQAEGDASATGSSAKYQYQYNPDPAYVGKLYFRIEQKDPAGKVSFSEVVIVDPNGAGSGSLVSCQTFPNPATNSLQVLFNSNQTGRFLVELVATSGQVVQKRAVTLAGNNQIRLDLTPQPVKGLYFLRTTDLTHEHSYVSKVFID